MSTPRFALLALVFVVTACAGARSAALWPHAQVGTVVSQNGKQCSTARASQIERALRSVTAEDFFNWKRPCLCGAMTLDQALHDTQGGGIFPRHAIVVHLRNALVVPLPGYRAPSGPRAVTRTLVLQRVLVRLDKNTTVFFGLPRPPGLKVNASIVFDGYSLLGDPFRLNSGECR